MCGFANAGVGFDLLLNMLDEGVGMIFKVAIVSPDSESFFTSTIMLWLSISSSNAQ